MFQAAPTGRRCTRGLCSPGFTRGYLRRTLRGAMILLVTLRKEGLCQLCSKGAVSEAAKEPDYEQKNIGGKQVL